MSFSLIKGGRKAIKQELSLLDKMRRRRRRLLYISLFFFCGLLLAGLVLVSALTIYTTYAQDLISKERLLNRNFHGLIIYDKNNKIIYESDGAYEVGTVTMSDLPRSLKYATLAVEDAKFYEHPGFSWNGIIRSITLNLQSNDAYAYGGSTITQQLVRNALLLDQSKSYVRKFKEVVLAVGVDKRYSKDQVLEMYFNSTYYGRGAYGIADASLTYFDKPLKDLTLSQSAFLAGLPNAPSVFGSNYEKAKERQKYVLKRMLEEKFITSTDFEEAINEEIVLAERKLVIGKYPHFSLYIRQKIINTYGENALDQFGYRVFTTLDSALQDLSQDAVSRQVKNLAKNKVTNGAAVVLDPKSGAVQAMIGSADWNNDDIDGKVNIIFSQQQPGSSIKPLLYMRAIERNLITAASSLDDSPRDFGGGYKPKNYDGKFRGNVTVRRALANSLNIPAVLVLEKIGLRDGISYARTLGLKSLGDPSNYGLSLVLGGAEVMPIEMAAAYATIANGGLYNEPYAIEKIVDKYGQTIFEHEHKPQRVADENAAFIITDILSDNKARQEIFGGALDLPNKRPAAVKTGTTDEYRDAWTIGFTPTRTVAVWVGNNNNQPMDSVAGSLGAAPIWKEIIEDASNGTQVAQFAKPAGVVEGQQCQLIQKTVVDNGQPKTFYEFSYVKEVFIRNSAGKLDNCDAVRKQVEQLQQGQGLTDPSVLSPAVAGDATETPPSPPSVH